MAKVSPDTVTAGVISYLYNDKMVSGFSFNHIGGADGGELANLLTMATSGPLHTYWGQKGKPGSGYQSSFSKKTETASAGYYGVTLEDYKVRAEATAADHSGILRFTFSQNDQSRIQIDLSHRNDGTSLHQTVKVTNDHTIEGTVDCPWQGGGWRFGQTSYKLYYHMEYSKPFTKVGVWSATLPPVWSDSSVGYHGKGKTISDPAFIDACVNAQVIPDCREKEGQHIGFYSEFPTKADEVVMVKAGISYVSIEGARANLAAEIPDWGFDRIHQQAREAWSKALDHLAVEGGTEDHKTIFYSAMYRSMLFPQIFADVDGSYTGGDHQVHKSSTYTNRTLFSGWDDYRSAYPLLTLVAPSVINDQINSMINLADFNKSHYFTRWEIMGCYSGIMTGNPEVIVVNDAWQKGIRNFDSEKAYEYSVATTEQNGNGKMGYRRNSIAETFDYGVDEWNVGHFALSLGKKDDAAKYLQSSLSYKNLFDPNQPWTYDTAGTDTKADWKGWFRVKDGNGNFDPWQGLTSSKGGRESSVYETGWTAYNDVPGLIQLLGGKQLFVDKLNDFFSRSPDYSKWNPYMGTANPSGGRSWSSPYNNPGNEPTELIAFLFNRAGAPWLTQKWVLQEEQVYNIGPEGVPGDDDVGQLSAWYVLSGIGLAQICPGDTRFEVFTPLFDKVTIKLDPKYAKGSSFIITAKNNSPQNPYIQSATLNGQPFNRCWLSYAEITAGGTLDLVLGPQPNKQWGVQ